MPLDDVLPRSQLPPLAGTEQIIAHFLATFGVRVDVEGLDALPLHVRLRLAGARVPEPPEAIVLDRALQAVPPAALRLIERVLFVDAGITGHLGAYASGVIRIGTAALQLRLPDRQFASKLSILAGTVLHEIGHAVYQQLLTPAQQFAGEDLYLAFLEEEDDSGEAEPTADEAEHHFVALFVAALAGIGYGPLGPSRVREMLKNLGVPLR